MQTLAQPRQDVIRLWGKQAVRQETKYRLMKYVLRVDHEGQTALHNVVTGQLELLTPEEVTQLEALPGPPTEALVPLIEAHTLVPVDYDEHQQVINLRTILRKLAPPVKGMFQFIILPTTACNARCYYCFEHGTKTVTMTEEVAENTVRFIAKNNPERKKIRIVWFGGEPTVAANRIDQISEGLQREQIPYESTMLSNGYLFDEQMVEKASKLWRLKYVQIVIDGTEDLYNKIKDYVNPTDNPYQRVMRNIGLLFAQNISVGVRMNVDQVNYQDFKGVAQDLVQRFPKHPHLNLSAYPIIGDYSNDAIGAEHGSESWILSRVIELNQYAKENGLKSGTFLLPSLSIWGCSADSDEHITISAAGHLAKCGERFEIEDAVGTVTEGITDVQRAADWHEVIESAICTDCAFKPTCVKLACCHAANSCYHQGRNQRYVWAIQNAIHAYKENRRR